MAAIPPVPQRQCEGVLVSYVIFVCLYFIQVFGFDLSHRRLRMEWDAFP